MAFCVQEYVVDVATNLHTREASTALRIEHTDARWFAKCDEQPIGLVVERHCVVCTIASWPARQLAPRVAVDDRNALLCRDVDKDPVRPTIQLEALWMRAQGYIRNLGTGGRFDDG